MGVRDPNSGTHAFVNGTLPYLEASMAKFEKDQKAKTQEMEEDEQQEEEEGVEDEGLDDLEEEYEDKNW